MHLNAIQSIEKNIGGSAEISVPNGIRASEIFAKEVELSAQFEPPSISNYYEDYRKESGEMLTWGVQSSWDGVDYSVLGNFASDKYAFVIDSGVSNSTGDLNIHQTWSKSWVLGEEWSVDLNGHGTHVAGTIAAKVNGSGVVGVAPNAMVIALKVFGGKTGKGSTLHVIDAIKYAVDVIKNNNLELSDVVINLSLGGPANEDLDTAIRDAAEEGIRFSIAAGNGDADRNGVDVDSVSPASAGDHANVYTVSAVDYTNKMASFSNWDDPFDGDDVDFSAPGVGIFSLTPSGDVEMWDGTSMAAPHVAGLLLLGDEIKAGAMGSPNIGGFADPLAVIGAPLSIPTDQTAPPPLSSSPPSSSLPSSSPPSSSSPSSSPSPSLEPSPELPPENYQEDEGFTQLSDADESLTGQSNIKLRMLGGNDYLEVTGGSNYANGNMGDDTIILRGGFGEYLGGKDSDTIQVFGAEEGTSVNGNLGEDYVTGTVAGVIYRGGKDNDFLAVSQGEVWGDKGADTFRAVAGDGFAVIQDYTIGEDLVEIEMDGSWSNVGDGLMFTDDSGDQLMLLLGINDVEQVTRV